MKERVSDEVKYQLQADVRKYQQELAQHYLALEQMAEAIAPPAVSSNLHQPSRSIVSLWFTTFSNPGLVMYALLLLLERIPWLLPYWTPSLVLFRMVSLLLLNLSTPLVFVLEVVTVVFVFSPKTLLATFPKPSPGLSPGKPQAFCKPQRC
jgi:hypothetical protein